MSPSERVRVTGRGLWRTGQVGVVDEVLPNGLVGVKFEGGHAVEFFAPAQLAPAGEAPDGPEAA